MKKLIAILTIAILIVGGIEAGHGGHGGHGGGGHGHGGWGHRGGGWRGRGGFFGGVGIGFGPRYGYGYPYAEPVPYPVPVAVTDAYDVDPYNEYISLFPGTFNRAAYSAWLYNRYPSRAAYWLSRR